MPRSLVLLCSCLVLGLGAAGCGNDEEDAGGGTTVTEEGQGSTTTVEGEDATKGGSAEVKMATIAFKPASITVKKGDTVTWTNEEDVGHDVTKTGGPGPDFKSGPGGGMMKGDTFKATFNKPGVIKYVCTVHGNMLGTITVK